MAKAALAWLTDSVYRLSFSLLLNATECRRTMISYVIYHILSSVRPGYVYL